METQFFVYASTPESKRTWIFIPDTLEARTEAISEGCTAFSTMSFAYEPEKGKIEPIRRGDLWMDFDHKKYPELAVKAARDFVDELCHRYAGVDPDMLRYYMSGSKGVHIAIPAVVFGGEHGHPELPRIHAEMLHYVRWIPVLKRNPTCWIDMQLYSMGKGHLLREANIKRPDGRYKVQVSYEKFMNEDTELLLNLTHSKRDEKIQTKPPCRSKMAELYEDALTGITRRKDKIKSILQCDFIKYCKDNQHELSEPEWFMMIGLFTKLGPRGRNLAHEYSKGHPNYSEKETNEKFDHFNRKGYNSYSCEKIKEVFPCQKQCPVHSPMELEGRIKSEQVVAAEAFKLREDGVYYSQSLCHDDDSIKICSPMKILGKLRNPDGSGWARLVAITAPDGRVKEVLIPMKECAGRGDSVRADLLDNGLEIPAGPKIATLVMEYLRLGAPDGELLQLIERIGWNGDVYVLPDEQFGGEFKEKTYVSMEIEHVHHVRGALSEWQNEIGRHCPENSLLTVAVCFALTGPLLRPLRVEGGGLHIFGSSSSGKTTLALVAGSVCGGGGNLGFVRQWRSTSNALDSTAAMHNDNLLVLDEIGQASAEVIFQTTYTLPNGQGKDRLRSDASRRKSYIWCINFLSTGEVSISDKIEETGKHRAMAGQEVRVINLPADGGEGGNVFSSYSGFASPAELSDHLKKASQNYYGTPLRHFLRSFCGTSLEEREKNSKKAERVIDHFVQEHSPEGASGQVIRVARKFGLIAAAGELGIEYGVLPLERGAASSAVAKQFRIWLGLRNGVGDIEIEKALQRIKDHFEKYCKLKYVDTDNTPYDTPRDFFGYTWEDRGERYFLMITQEFKKIAQGVNRQALLSELEKRGWLARTSTGKIMGTKSVKGETQRGIIFIPAAWSGEAPEVVKAPKKHERYELDMENVY